MKVMKNLMESIGQLYIGDLFNLNYNKGEQIIEVNNSFKTKQGTVEFKGNLSQEEADFVIKIGLSVLLQQGALSFKDLDESNEDGEEVKILVPGNSKNNPQ